MIKVITFDLGNVLFDFDPLRAASGFLKLTGGKKSPFEVLRFFQESAVEKAYTEGHVTTQEFYEHVAKGLEMKGDFEAFKRCYCDIFVVNKETFALAGEVRARGCKCFILSNTNELHYDYLCDFNPALRSFDHAVLSYKEHCQKPHAMIYERLIASAACEPEEICFTDDLLENVQAAEAAGICGHHFKSVQGLRADLVRRNVLL